MSDSRYLLFRTPEDVSTTIRNLLDEVRVSDRQDSLACLRTAMAPTSGEGQVFITGLLTFFQVSGTNRGSGYPNLRLDELWMPETDAVALLARTVSGAADLSGLSIPKLRLPSGQKQSVRAGDSGGISGWPEWALRFSVDRSSHEAPPSEPVVAPGLRPYSSGVQAVLDWVWSRTTTETSLPELNALLVVVPDYRARIRSAEWRSGRVSAVVEGPEEDLELQVLVHGRGTHWAVQAIKPVPRDEVLTVTVPPGLDRVELFLVRSTRTLASHVVLHSAGEDFEAKPGGPTPEEQAAADLRSGEGQRVEFKPFILPKNQKEAEIVETIVAFSNTEGGRLYIGVRPDGTPEGEAALRRAGEAEADTAATTLVERLRELATEKVKPDVQMEVQVLKISGEPVIVASVSAGAGGPYSTHANDVYMRSGATNRRPDPRTELPDLGKQRIGSTLTVLKPFR